MKYLKSVGYFVFLFLFFILLTTLFSYFSMMNDRICRYLSFAGVLFSVFVATFFLGRKTNTRGYLEGIKFGASLVLLLVLFRYLGLGKEIMWNSIIYYLILIITSIVGSIVGINKKTS